MEIILLFVLANFSVIFLSNWIHILFNDEIADHV